MKHKATKAKSKQLKTHNKRTAYCHKPLSTGIQHLTSRLTDTFLNSRADIWFVFISWNWPAISGFCFTTIASAGMHSHWKTTYLFCARKTCNLFLYHALAEGLSARGYGCGTQVCLASSVHIKRFRFTFLSFVDWFTIGPKQNSRGWRWQRRQKQYWRLVTQDKKRHEYMCRPALKWDFNWVRGEWIVSQNALRIIR